MNLQIRWLNVIQGISLLEFKLYFSISIYFVSLSIYKRTPDLLLMSITSCSVLAIFGTCIVYIYCKSVCPTSLQVMRNPTIHTIKQLITTLSKSVSNFSSEVSLKNYIVYLYVQRHHRLLKIQLSMLLNSSSPHFQNQSGIL